MTDRDLELKLDELVRNERNLTQEILALIREAERRRLFLDQGFPNAYEWLVQKYGYSHSAAHRRIQASRLLTDVPALTEKLTDGRVNLTTLAQVQSAIRREERLKGVQVPREKKAELVEKIENKSSEQCARLLAETFPETVKQPESIRPINGDESRLSVVLDEETLAILAAIKFQLSHTNPDASWADAIKYAAKNSTRRLSAAGKIPGKVRKQVFDRAGGTCEYKDAKTGRRCNSRFQLEVDHLRPRMLGGGNDIDNLRCLCKQHNLLAAEERLGSELMSKYWPRWRLLFQPAPTRR